MDGYPSRAHWSTALTIINDYKLYGEMRRCANEILCGKEEWWDMVDKFMTYLPPRTPEGEVWQRSTIEDIFREEMQSDG